ncbi:MAG: Lrp/AsnC ligand binding domain-containing protein [candidate division WOR-3 bacterium]|nr:MAG: Lrp/AsnC ligand binding domain-containing protein [candidate division WOR-3 bacterium]
MTLFVNVFLDYSCEIVIITQEVFMAVAAYLFINTDTAHEQEVVNILRTIEGVKQAHIVTGLHDVICYIEGESLSEVKSIIIEKIRGIPGIQRTVTCFALDAGT